MYRNVLNFLLLACTAHANEIISDLGSDSFDVGRASSIKNEQFWQPLLQVAEAIKMEQHLALYVDAAKAIEELPAENSYVREALTDALTRLQRADDMVLAQAADTSLVANTQLDSSSARVAQFSFLTGGQNWLSSALQRFIGDNRDGAERQVSERQKEVPPVLRGVAAATGNVLSDSRLASKRSFDVLKYDIYNKGVPKTPENAKAIANRLVDAAGETRHHFTRLITEAAQSITRDVENQHTPAAATVAQSDLNAARGMMRTTAKSQIDI
jgi:hypothetical protein